MYVGMYYLERILYSKSNIIIEIYRYRVHVNGKSLTIPLAPQTINCSLGGVATGKVQNHTGPLIPSFQNIVNSALGGGPIPLR